LTRGILCMLASTLVLAAAGCTNPVLQAMTSLVTYHKVTYDSNGATGGTVPTDSSSYLQGKTVTVLDNSGGLAKTAYSFAGWNTAADGTGTAYTTGQTFTMGGADVMLYAAWTDVGYAVTYDGNGFTGGSVPASPTAYLEGRTVTVLGNTGSLVRTYYGFDKWNTKADGSGAAYNTGETFAMPGYAVTLYAQWTALHYTVTYDGNGGSGTALGDSTGYLGGATVTVKGIGTLIRYLYTFVGWNTAADGGGTAYAVGATFTITGNTTLYAIWTKSTYVVRSYKDGTIYVPCYWTGTERTPLSVGGSYSGYATAIYLYNGTIYIAGYYYNGKNIACYWDGGTKHDFDTGSYSAYTTSIHVTSSGVYTGGYYFDGSYNRPCYWAGTTKYDFYRPATATSSLYSIYVYNDVVYASGNYLNGSYYVPCYWAGANTSDSSTRKDLDVASASTDGYAQSIYVTSGPTAYTAGYCNTSSVRTACYWTGTSRQDIVVDGASNTFAYSLCISSDTLYIAGSYYAGTAMTPCYWHGTGSSMTKQDLDSGSYSWLEATSICVSGSTVNTAGYGRIMSPDTSYPCFWTGTAKTDLTGSTDYGSAAPTAGIAVP